MIRKLAVGLIFIFWGLNAPVSFAQVDPWPFLMSIRMPEAILPSRGEEPRVMAARKGKDEVVVMAFGFKRSPSYEAVLVQMPGILPDEIVGHKGDKAPVLRLDFVKKGDGSYVNQVTVPFAVPLVIKTNSKSVWLIVGKDEVVSVDVTEP